MDVSFIYNFNLINSSEFYALDQLYQFLLKGQDNCWDNWWKSQTKKSPKEILGEKANLEAFFHGAINTKNYRPAVNQEGLVIGNIPSFLKSFYDGDVDFFDIVK